MDYDLDSRVYAGEICGGTNESFPVELVIGRSGQIAKVFPSTGHVRVCTRRINIYLIIGLEYKNVSWAICLLSIG